MSLEIQQSDLGTQKLIKLIGRLDTETSPDFELAAYDAQNAGAKDFIVDLSEVTYVSSAGLRVLLALAKKLEGKGSMKLAGLKGVVKEVFDKSGFARLFAIFADVSAASGGQAASAAVAAAPRVKSASELLGGSAPTAPRAAAPTQAPQGFFAKLLAMIGLGKR
jgi:anti-anti-sigma factor